MFVCGARCALEAARAPALSPQACSSGSASHSQGNLGQAVWCTAAPAECCPGLASHLMRQVCQLSAVVCPLSSISCSPQRPPQQQVLIHSHAALAIVPVRAQRRPQTCVRQTWQPVQPAQLPEPRGCTQLHVLPGAIQTVCFARHHHWRMQSHRGGLSCLLQLLRLLAAAPLARLLPLLARPSLSLLLLLAPAPPPPPRASSQGGAHRAAPKAPGTAPWQWAAASPRPQTPLPAPCGPLHGGAWQEGMVAGEGSQLVPASSWESSREFAKLLCRTGRSGGAAAAGVHGLAHGRGECRMYT